MKRLISLFHTLVGRLVALYALLLIAAAIAAANMPDHRATLAVAIVLAGSGFAVYALLRPLLLGLHTLAERVASLPLRNTPQTPAHSDMPAELRGLIDNLDRAAAQLAQQAATAHAETARNQAVLAAALDCVVAVDNGGRITELNPAAERIFGYSRHEAIGQDMSTLLLPLAKISGHIEAMQPYQEGTAAAILGKRRTVSARRRDGSEFPAEIMIVAADVASRREFTVWLRDITDSHQATEAMLKARLAAEDANRAKSDFLANMSHEIRTPLNAIIGITELAMDTELSREQREYLGLVRSAGDALLSIINELLDYSKIEAGHLDFEQINFSLRHAIATAVRTLAPRAHEQRLELLIHVDSDVPDALIGDPHRLRQVLTNLIGNAIKFTTQGEIEVQVSRLPVQEDDNVTLQFCVRDTGIGIPREKLGVIFDAFTQVDTSTTRKFGGTGLGLAICTRLVEAMGGRIWAESEPGHGSQFRFTARLGLVPLQARPALPTHLSGLRILVAETNIRHRALLGEQLADWGMRVRGVDTVAGLLAELEAGARAGLPYRFVLLDSGLLEIDGAIIVDRIRTQLPPPALIVMQPVNLRRRSTDTEPYPGIAARLLKPLLPAELLDALYEVLGERDAAGDEARHERAPAAASRALQILLAEDNPINQTLALRMLDKLGHHTHVVANGQAAIDAYSERQYDVILMDVQMPIMGGFEATAAIRAQEKISGRHVPVVAMTAHAMAGDRERCLAAGMDDYIAKPIQSATLDSVLKNVVQSTEATTLESGAHLMNIAVPFDRNALIDSLGGDLELYGEIVRLFLSHYPRELEALNAYLAAGDVDNLHRTAHSLKGAVSNFSAPRATTAARTLEFALKGGSLADNTPALVAETIAAVQELGLAMHADLGERV